MNQYIEPYIPYHDMVCLLTNVCPSAVAKWLRPRAEGHMPPLNWFESRHGLMPQALPNKMPSYVLVMCPCSINNANMWKFNCTSSTKKKYIILSASLLTDLN